MLKAYWNITVRDKDGKIICRKRFRSHSFLVAFIKYVKGEFATVFASTTGNGNTSITDTGGTTVNFPDHSSDYGYYTHMSTLGGAGDDSQGIVVGTGTSANTTTTYALSTKIANGTGSGQLQYGAMTVNDVVASGNTLYFLMTRTFTNISGASITVNEVGIQCKCYAAGASTHTLLLARDVLTNGVTIPNGGSATFQYTISITVS